MEIINTILEFVNANSTLSLIVGIFTAAIMFIVLLNMIVIAKINRQRKKINRSFIFGTICTMLSFLPVFIPAKTIGKATGFIFRLFK